MINQSGYRRAFRYLKSSVSQSSFGSRLSTGGNDRDLEAVNRFSENALELVFFPSYARLTGRDERDISVNVHGWVFSPVPAGKQSRRNRYTMLLARSLAGLPALSDVPVSSDGSEKTQSGTRPSTGNTNSSTWSFKSDASSPIHANSGLDPEASGHLEQFGPSDSSAPTTPSIASVNNFSLGQMILPDAGIPRSNSMRRQDSADSHKFAKHYTAHDLVTCHANLSSRISPFLAKAAAERPVKCDIYANGARVGTMRLVTGENGHFRGTIKIPRTQVEATNLRSLEARVDDGVINGATEVQFVGDSGVSIISDMDDTVKHTDILAGMREAFRNAFVRDLPSLEITGVRAWYESMSAMGCNIHYVSNAPYQLWPCLASFIKVAGLPTGTIHLKQYSGFLQGMFEPAAEKKRANVERILRDFPERRFILIGDSGEQDLELYSELARSEFSRQILGIFIRDVSSVESLTGTPTGESGEDFFSAGRGDNVVDSGTTGNSLASVAEVASPAPRLPDRQPVPSLLDPNPKIQTSNDISSAKSNNSHWADMLSLSITSLGKDHAAEAVHNVSNVIDNTTETDDRSDSRPPVPRKPTGLRFWTKSIEGSTTQIPADESSRTHARPSASRTNSSSSLKSAATTIPATSSRRPNLLRSMSASSSYYGEGRRLTKAQERTQAWEVRLAKARAMLPKEIKLYTWKEGTDCQHHAEALIRKALRT